ncbi:S41 family peptidase [Desulfoluna sp.]|uniref:S41 family peptidase n=1 Tax=Desulfoluna sp. TaxID=2045199 RepID=UPI00262AF9B8|nr:S41 family peptidase [Desulfoluna sp.]
MKRVSSLMALLWLLVPLCATAAENGTYRNLRIFTDVIEEIERSYVDEPNSEQLIEEAIKGMVNSLDPHSALLPPQAHSELQEDTRGRFSGVGLVLSMRNEKLIVVSPIDGSPAKNAGIRGGDLIIAIDGEKTATLTMEESITLMRGPRGSMVSLTVLQKTGGKEVRVTLRRDEIPLQSVAHYELKRGFPFIAVTSFNDNTARDFEAALLAHEANGPVKGLVLDLRDNPGGILQQAVDIVDFFIEDGVIVSIKGRSMEERQVWRATTEKPVRSFPVVVLINGGSASASEIVAGALKDRKRGLILGTTSFGKGSVQNIIPLTDGYGLKLTVALYYTPSGVSIQAKGIVPDVELPFQEMDFTPDEPPMTERDLPNHIKPRESADEEPLPQAPDRLKRDNQVQRALELLLSRDIFGKG